MPLPRFCSLAHLCPLLGFVLMSLNTGHHEVEDVSVIQLSFLGPHSRLMDVIGNLGTLITDNMSHNARSTRDSKQRLMSDHKFDTSKIRQYTGDCTLGDPDEYWLCPGS